MEGEVTIDKLAVQKKNPWSINWKHNPAVKLVGMLVLIAVFLDLIVVGVNRILPEVISGVHSLGGLFFLINFMIVAFALVQIILCSFYRRSLDRIDKISLFISLLLTMFILQFVVFNF